MKIKATINRVSAFVQHHSTNVCGVISQCKNTLAVVAVASAALLVGAPAAMAAEPSELLDIDLSVSNNHLWRGYEVGDGFVLKSTFAVHDVNNHVRAGVWSGTNTSGSFKEFDFFLELSGGGFTFALWDIYNFSPGASYNNKEFFNYTAKETGRFLDASIAYNFGEKFPLTLSWATILFGRDRNAANTENKYSTFVFAEYPVIRTDTWGLSAGIGGAFALNECGSDSHFYGDKPGIMHIQIKGSYNLKINDKYTLPLHAMVMFNPEGDRAFYQVGATLFSF